MQALTLFSRLKVFFAWAAVSSVLVLISVLVAVGSLIWLAERRQNSSQFSLAIRPGLANGMWFALVTLTTVDYGYGSTCDARWQGHHSGLDGDVCVCGLVDNCRIGFSIHLVPVQGN